MNGRGPRSEPEPRQPCLEPGLDLFSHIGRNPFGPDVGHALDEPLGAVFDVAAIAIGQDEQIDIGHRFRRLPAERGQRDIATIGMGRTGNGRAGQNGGKQQFLDGTFSQTS